MSRFCYYPHQLCSRYGWATQVSPGLDAQARGLLAFEGLYAVPGNLLGAPLTDSGAN
jgi:hypothetical protein